MNRLIALLPLLALTAAAPGEQRIDVALSNFKFTPSAIALKHGQAYVLHLSSTGSHSLGAPAFFAAASIAPADRAKVQNGKVEVSDDPVDIHFTAPKPGRYPMKCTHFLHAGFGMTGAITVS